MQNLPAFCFNNKIADRRTKMTPSFFSSVGFFLTWQTNAGTASVFVKSKDKAQSLLNHLSKFQKVKLMEVRA